MPSSSNLINQIQDNLDSKLYLHCKPILSVPQDLPKLKKQSDKLWSAKLLIKTKTSTIPISEWFSIPKNNINSSIKIQPYGPFILILNNLSQKDINKLFLQTKPIFRIREHITRDVTKWLSQQS